MNGRARQEVEMIDHWPLMTNDENNKSVVSTPLAVLLTRRSQGSLHFTSLLTCCWNAGSAAKQLADVWTDQSNTSPLEPEAQDTALAGTLLYPCYAVLPSLSGQSMNIRLQDNNANG